MNITRSPRGARTAFIFFLFFAFITSFSIEISAKGKRAKAKAQGSRSSRHAGGRQAQRRSRNRRQVASDRHSRRRMSKRELRAERQRDARERSAYLAKLQRRAGRKLSKRELAAEMRRFSSGRRRAQEEARRRAEAARRAAIARQRAIDDAMRNEVQSNIAKDNTTGEDLEVRNAAVAALGNHAGTVVVMDPRTGRVYTVVNQEWGVRRGFKPCSTIKLVTGVAGLSENVIPPVDVAGDGYRMDLTAALAHSNNPFFEQVGSKIGFDKMVTYARELGLGEKTGTNLPFEFQGRLPEMKPGFVERRMFSYADGFEVTPLQLGTLVSAMANGGKLLVPQVPRTSKEQSKFVTKVRRQLPIGPDIWQRMVPGMVGAVNYGSGRRAYDPTQTVAGKTGTCIGSGGWVGLFTSYAPLANPRLAVVVIAQGSDGRNHFPAAVAGEIYRELNHRFGTAINLQVATTADDEEKDADSEEGADAAAGTTATTAADATAAAAPSPEPTSATRNTPVKETVAPRGTVKRVLMPIEKKPVDTQTKTTSAPSSTTKTPVTNSPLLEQRPRRAQPGQP